MSTCKQVNKIKKKIIRHSSAAALLECPQKRGSVLRPKVVTPKKPNSARRPVVKAGLTNFKFVVAHIPGIGHTLRKHSSVLVRGGGARDLPGVRHSCVRGALDFLGVKQKSRRRSIYGVKQPEQGVRKLRRKFRKFFVQ